MMVPQSQMLSLGLQNSVSGGIAASAEPSERKSNSPDTPEQSSGLGDMSEDSDLSDDTSESEDVSDNETLAARHKSLKRTAPAADHLSHHRRTSSDSGSKSSANRKRRNLFPAIRKSQRCGKCHTCLNPQLKKACQTVREQMMREAGSQSTPSRRTAPQPSSRGAKAAADIEQYTHILAPFVNSAGGLADSAAVPAFIAVLPKFSSTLSRFLVSTVLGVSSQAALSQFMGRGGVDVLSDWMLQAMEEDTEQASNLLVDILTTLKTLPVTKAFVQSTKSAKVIGALRKHDSADVRKMAREVVAVWMKAMPATSSKATSAKPAAPGPAPAAGRLSHPAPSTAQPAPKRPKLTQETSNHATAATASAQARPAANGAGAARTGVASSATASGFHVVSDNDLFKVAARPKAPVRLQGLNKQQPKTVQTIDPSEAGKLLSSKPPPAAASVQANQQPNNRQLIRLQLQVDESQSSVSVTITVTPSSNTAGKPSSAAAAAARAPSTSSVSRLAGRRLGFGAGLGSKPGGTAGDSSISALLGGAWAQGGTAGNADADGTEQRAAKKARKGPAKRVSWRIERELVAVRWFIKEDPPAQACKDAHLSDEQLRALAAAQQQHHSSFNQAARMEHMRERQIIEQQHKEAQEAAARMRAQIEAMHPTTQWYGPPSEVVLDTSWGVAFGEESSEAKQHTMSFDQLLTALAAVNPRAEPLESHQFLQPPSALFNVPYHDRNVRIVPLNTAVQAAPQQQQQPAAPGMVAGPAAPPQQQQQHFVLGGPPQMQQQQVLPGPPLQQQQQQQVLLPGPPPQQQQPGLLQMQHIAPPSAQGGQLVLQPINEPLGPQQQQQQGPPQLFAGPPVASGPVSGGDQQQQLMQALQSLSQGGFLQALQGGGGGQLSLGPTPGQLQQQVLQQPPQQQMLQPPLQQQMLQQPLHQQQIPGMHVPPPQPPSAAPPQHGLMQPQAGVPMQVRMPDGQIVTMVANGPPGQPVQLPPGVVLLPQQPQQPQPVMHQQPGAPPPFAPQQMQQQQFGPGGPLPVEQVGVEHADEQDQRWDGGRGRGRGEGGRGPKGRGGGRGKHRHGGHGHGAEERRHNKRECKFFTSARGCQKGDKCDFLHIMPGEQFNVRDKRRAQQ